MRRGAGAGAENIKNRTDSHPRYSEPPPSLGVGQRFGFDRFSCSRARGRGSRTWRSACRGRRRRAAYSDSQFGAWCASMVLTCRRAAHLGHRVFGQCSLIEFSRHLGSASASRRSVSKTLGLSHGLTARRLRRPRTSPVERRRPAKSSSQLFHGNSQSQAIQGPSQIRRFASADDRNTLCRSKLASVIDTLALVSTSRSNHSQFTTPRACLELLDAIGASLTRISLLLGCVVTPREGEP